MISERKLSDLLRQLQALYKQLDEAKLVAAKDWGRPRVRQSHSTPRTPGGAATNFSVDLEQRLFEITRDCANHIDPARVIRKNADEMLLFLRFRVNLLVELEFVEDIRDELEFQVREIMSFLGYEDPRVLACRPERWLSGQKVMDKLACYGVVGNPKTVAKWAQRGLIESRVVNGRAQYRFSQVLARYIR